jgi:hypothetical protein
MNDLHLLEDCGAIVCNQNFSSRVLDLENASVNWNCAKVKTLTILSIPRGPRLVRTTSATADGRLIIKIFVTFGGNDVGRPDVLGLFGFERSTLILAGLDCTHLN